MPSVSSFKAEHQYAMGMFRKLLRFFVRCQWCHKRINEGRFCSAACEDRAFDELAYGA